MLVLVRHGRTDANAAGLLLGRADPELDGVGKDQGAALARALGRIPRVISSPLRRAVQTAELLSDDIAIDDRWIELDYGDLDQRRGGDLPRDVWTRWFADPAFVPPGGESLVTLATRVWSACEELAEDART